MLTLVLEDQTEGADSWHISIDINHVALPSGEAESLLDCRVHCVQPLEQNDKPESKSRILLTSCCWCYVQYHIVFNSHAIMLILLLIMLFVVLLTLSCNDVMIHFGSRLGQQDSLSHLP